jgi:predicted transcriptional regulator
VDNREVVSGGRRIARLALQRATPITRSIVGELTTMSEQNEILTGLTAEVVSAYVSNNPVPRADLAELIANVHGAMAGLSRPPAPEKPVPLVDPKRTIKPDYIISLEDGKRYKSMKRHLGRHGLTPDEYRAKWDLPRDYPMVAPNYAAARSELAKSMGLGRKLGTKMKVPAKRRGSRR